MQNLPPHCWKCGSTENLMISGHYKTSTYHKCRKCHNEISKKYYKPKPKLADWGKVCRYCNSTDNLVIYSETKKGEQAWICTDCNTNKSREYRKNGGNVSIRKATKKWNSKNKEKHNVHGILRYYEKKGSIIRPETCSKCNKKVKVDGHHYDYSKPLEVVWLCRKCHKEEHAKTKII